MKAGSKDLRALVRRLRPGLALVSDGKSKARIVDEHGAPLRYPDGRVVTVPNTPTDMSVRTLESRLSRMGALR